MAGKIDIRSPELSEGSIIPEEYTCDSVDVSPELHLGSVPPGTKSIAVLCEDVDAPRGIFIHWILFNLPPDVRDLPKDIPPVAVLDNGAKQGKNDANGIGYHGPCPPSGTHRYYFRFYALDTMLNLPAGIKGDQFKQAIQGHILAEGQLMSKYSR